MPQPQLPPACGGSGATGDDAVQRRTRLTPAAGVVSHVLQPLPPACQRTPTVATAHAHQWPWLRQALAVTDAGHGRWPDGSRLDAARGAVLPCAAVAPARRGVSTLW